jgi:hypothetical protein
MSTADRIRELAEKWNYWRCSAKRQAELRQKLAAETGASRQAVASALRSTGKVGRPTTRERCDACGQTIRVVSKGMD